MGKLVANSTLIVGLVGAIFTLVTAFGVNVTDTQETALVAVVSAVLALLGAWFSPSVPSVGRGA